MSEGDILEKVLEGDMSEGDMLEKVLEGIRLVVCIGQLVLIECVDRIYVSG